MAQRWGIRGVLEVDELLVRAREIEVVLNLTIPQAHGEVALAALAAGKVGLQRSRWRYYAGANRCWRWQ